MMKNNSISRISNLYAPFCVFVTSATTPLAIGGVTDEDGEQKPAPVLVKLEGSEGGKEEGTAPAANTTAPAQLACHAGGACCECRYQSSCKTARCACHRAGHNWVSCRCLMRCPNVAPQTQQDEQRKTQERLLGGEGERKGKRRSGHGKGGQNRVRAGGTGTGKQKHHEVKQRPTPPSAAGNQREGEEVGRRRDAGKSGRGGGERR